MKKTKLTRSLLAACSIVALSAVMYGCTHSSGPSQTDLDAANAATAAADAEAKVNADAAAAAAVAAKAAADEAAADAATAATDAAAVAKAASDDAAAVAKAASDDAAAADKAASDDAAAAAKAAADDAAAAAKAAADEAADDAEAARQAAQDEADRLQGEVDAAAAAKASDDAKELLNMALVDVDPATNVGPDPDDVQLVTAPDATLSVSNDGMLTAEATGYTMADMAPDMIEGWRGAVLTNVGGDTAVVYSDIGNDGTVSLLDRYDSTRPMGGNPRLWTVTEAVAGSIPWSEVRRPGDETSFAGPDGSAMLTFMGSVHDIDGMFSCAVAAIEDCRAPARYSDGSVETAVSDTANGAVGGWTFVPDEGADIYTDDPAYLTFGWWLAKGPDGKPDFVRLIARATPSLIARDDTSTSGANLRGAATYKGGAAGKYAMASAAEDMYEGGHFTATATLTVDFDVDLDADPLTTTNNDDGIALSGMIDNFMTGDTARPDWSVTLMADRTPDVADNAATTGAQPLSTLVDIADGVSTMTTKWSTGAAQSGKGTWAAMFHGGNSDPDAAINAETNTAHPMAVTGTFNAHIGTADAGAVGRLQGAFGANLMADE